MRPLISSSRVCQVPLCTERMLFLAVGADFRQEGKAELPYDFSAQKGCAGHEDLGDGCKLVQPVKLLCCCRKQL